MSARGPFLREADGGMMLFYCPGCRTHHGVIIGEGRWSFDGNDLAPTIRPSVLVNRGRACPSVHQCHSFITAGSIQFLGDCSHELAGQTVPMVDLEGADNDT